MAQKFLYIFDEFVPYPISEYSGLWNVIAENDDECFELSVEHDNEMYPEHYSKLRENILKARKFALIENVKSSVVEAFRT